MKNILSILIIDDDRVSQIYLSELIDMILGNVKVVRAESGEQALELLKKQSFHFIFSDILMPGLSQEKLFNELKEAARYSQTTKIVAISGMDDIEEIKKMSPGASIVLRKPIDREVLEKVLSGEGIELKKEDGAGEEKLNLDLNLIVKLYQNKPEKLLNLLNLYKTSLPKQYAGFKTAFEESNFDKLKSCAHSLKNSFAYLGAAGLRSSALYIEENVNSSNNIDKVTASANKILNSEDIVLDKIEELIRKYD
jgi:YesN/AraC family two-component response regulator